jgi:hypothetical protein
MTAMISYSRADWRRVKPVVTFLKNGGVPVWLDRDEIQPNAPWRSVLLRTPKNIDAFVPFLSDSYIASEMCRMELFLARSFDRPIFPVMLDECWERLDSQEETKYIASIFAARLGAQKLVGLSTTRKEILNRLLRAIQNRLSKASPRGHNAYISYPGSAEFATKVHAALSDEEIRPWIATMNCEVGDDWRKVQVQAMAKAKAHVVIISEDFLNANDVLRTEVLMAEALQLPTFCVKAPPLDADEGLSSRVYNHIANGAFAYRRLVERQWYEPRHIKRALRADVLKALEPAGAGQ